MTRKRAAEIAAEVAADLWRTTAAIMNRVEPGWPGDVDEVEWGQATDGRLTLHVGERVYHFTGNSRERIVEQTLGSIRLLGREGVIEEREVVRPSMN